MSTAMRVLFLTHSYPRASGDAAGSFILKLAASLRDENIDVSVVAPAGEGLPASEVIGGVPVHRFRYAPRRFQKLAYTGYMADEVRRSLSAKFALLGFLGSEFASGARIRREFQPDLVHAHWWFPGGLVGTWIAALAGLPLVTTLHGTDVRLAKGASLARPLFRHVLSHSSAVTTVSEWLATEASAIVPRVKPVVAPMPVSTELFVPGNGRQEGRLLFVGRLNAQKGIEGLLEAMARMRTTASLDVIGGGPDAGTLKDRAQALGIGGRVRWHGALPQPRLAEFYRTAAALVVPSLGEGFGMVAVEAQLCETPVVAYDSGGLADSIADGSTGYLVPPGDIDALARSLDRVLADPSRADVGRAGRQSALARFAPESAARRYAQVYRSVLAPSAS
jgi:glycosyltransferase involved in cell wall biosynthesis